MGQYVQGLVFCLVWVNWGDYEGILGNKIGEVKKKTFMDIKSIGLILQLWGVVLS